MTMKVTQQKNVNWKNNILVSCLVSPKRQRIKSEENEEQ
jgi:hypothetical protein